MIYKILSGILLVFLLALGGMYLYEKHQHKKEAIDLYNQIVKLEGTVKEANNAISSRGIEIENLKTALETTLANNKELAKNIKKRDEQIVALNTVVLKLKSQTFDINNAQESTVVGNDKDPSSVRSKVVFDQTKEALRVHGYTLTNPAYASVNVEYIKDLNLTLVLVKDKEGHFKTYLDSQNSDVVPVDLKLSVDPSVFDRKWYEKINLLSSVAAGKGLLVGVSLGYDVKSNLSIFGSYYGIYDGASYMNFYGGSVVWKPFLY